MDYRKLAELLYPNVNKDINYYFEKYPSRNLMKGAVVTRLSPSPTGYFHFGGLFQAIFHQMLSKAPSSVFYLRLEDTDQKREIVEARKIIYSTLRAFEIEPTEGFRGDEADKGIYGPYVQSQRLDIYHAFAKYLVAKGRAFPCFCSKCEDKEDIVAKREQEIEENSETIDHDKCRELSLEEINIILDVAIKDNLRFLDNNGVINTEVSDDIASLKEENNVMQDAINDLSNLLDASV